MNEPNDYQAPVALADVQAFEAAIARAEALAAEWRDTAENYRLDLQVARDALATAQALALANGLRADAAERRVAQLEDTFGGSGVVRGV